MEVEALGKSLEVGQELTFRDVARIAFRVRQARKLRVPFVRVQPEGLITLVPGFCEPVRSFEELERRAPGAEAAGDGESSRAGAYHDRVQHRVHRTTN